MASTTFSGPIKAGTISNTTGTTLGSNVKNVGQVVMCQSQAVTQADGTTNIVIPANSQIVAIELSVDVIWTGAATTAGIGWTGDATGSGVTGSLCFYNGTSFIDVTTGIAAV